MRTPIALIGVAALALLLLRSSRGGSVDPSTGLDEIDMGAAIDPSNDVAEWYDWQPSYDDDLPAVEDIMTADPESNLRAFLYMLQRAEHRRTDADSGLAYRTFYGGARFSDLSDHPVLTGELRGVPLPPAMCKAAGYASGKCVSTAAGAYQFTVPTWQEMRNIAPRLTDFSPESQDEAARRLLYKIGALQPILQGDITRGIALAATRWASLPGSTAKQGPKPLDTVLALFNEGMSEQGAA